MLLGCSALSKFGIIPSTIHGMIKFATCKGVATMNSAIIQPICANVNTQCAVIENAGAEDNLVVINCAYPEQTIKFGNNLDADVKKQLVQLLIANMDVFAWCEQDMTGVPRKIAEHRLNANPSLKPIIQKRRGMTPDRMQWLCGEVTKLVKAGILREVKYQTWVANPVLVKKSDGSWRMCIDFKDINKACPKDNYPLLKINWKVESLNEYPLNAFWTLTKGTVKSQWQKKMKIKPRFIRAKGIKANPKKIAAIKNMTAPKTILEVQSLTGKLAALTRFLSKPAE
ncbi:uncharacterized protein [Rutidosis leptorrhynchoides]|uniref:uncharacterized protein n=1 Tax=Rutidosis leptorrhynchoides TaxID=125765 RepID=UPI003A99DDDE